MLTYGWAGAPDFGPGGSRFNISLNSMGLPLAVVGK